VIASVAFSQYFSVSKLEVYHSGIFSLPDALISESIVSRNSSEKPFSKAAKQRKDIEPSIKGRMAPGREGKGTAPCERNYKTVVSAGISNLSLSFSLFLSPLRAKDVSQFSKLQTANEIAGKSRRAFGDTDEESSCGRDKIRKAWSTEKREKGRARLEETTGESQLIPVDRWGRLCAFCEAPETMLLHATRISRDARVKEREREKCASPSVQTILPSSRDMRYRDVFPSRDRHHAWINSPCGQLISALCPTLDAKKRSIRRSRSPTESCMRARRWEINQKKEFQAREISFRQTRERKAARPEYRALEILGARAERIFHRH